MTSFDIIKKYLSFFEKRGHKQIPNASLVPENDPTTLFTSSGMQPLVPYLLGEAHPLGKRLVNVQNCFRAQDIEEVGDNRHTTFFRMLGNWSLGDYFKKEQLSWFFEFLTKELQLDPKKLYVSVFEGSTEIPRDEESASVWKELFESVGIDPKERIFYYGFDKNWWSRAGEPDRMPAGEPGGPDSEVFYRFNVEHDQKFGKECHPNCNCGRFLEIGNSVFMQYVKQQDGSFKELPQKNVDFGGGLERLLAAVEDQQDIFKTSLLSPIVSTIRLQTGKDYQKNAASMRIIADHFVAATFITANDVTPSNKEQGYILRRLIRRGLDNFYQLGGDTITSIIEKIIEQYKNTDQNLLEKFEKIKLTILEEEETYKRTREQARRFITKKYPSTSFDATQDRRSGQARIGDELMGVTEISADDAFLLYTTHGLSPTQIKSLGFLFDDHDFSELMKKHQEISKAGAHKRFAGGLADHSEETIKGHTATHLLHQALRDVLGPSVHQTGSNITPERIRFDFSYDKKLTDEKVSQVEHIVNDKIVANLPVHFEIMTIDEAKKRGAIGLFEEKYGEVVKVYFIGRGPSTRTSATSGGARFHSDDVSSSERAGRPYSVEFCGGPHVDFTGRLKRFTIKKQEALGKGMRRIYAVVG